MYRQHEDESSTVPTLLVTLVTLHCRGQLARRCDGAMSWLLMFASIVGIIDAYRLTMSSVPVPVQVADKLISSVFAVKPLFKLAAKGARNKMIQQGLSIGVDWDKSREIFQSKMDVIEHEYNKLTNKNLIYPDYYLKEFHAYENGNLGWDAAFEVESAALTVHSPIFVANKGDPLQFNGDNQLRDNFHKNMKQIFGKNDFKPKKILDVGCSTGLSTMKLLESFPEAEIIGMDLSPHMLAVAKFNLLSNFSARKSISYIHGLGEDTSLGNGDVNLVTACLIAHELPAAITKQVLIEAYKILPSGGAFSLMDINPKSLFFQKFASNPFAFAAFKSTEPWIQSYVKLDLEQTLEEVGFRYTLNYNLMITLSSLTNSFITAQ